MTIRTLQDVPAAVEATLNFTPEESLVVLGLGPGSPAARLDLAPAEVMRASLASALVHWREGVLVVVYSDIAGRAEAAIERLSVSLPGIPVLAVFRVTAGRIYGPGDPAGEELPSRPDSPRRADVMETARLIDDGEEAEQLAWATYRQGNGAAAWCLIDRARELGRQTASLDELTRRLVEAVRPDREERS